jgi:hypothetical protein
VSGSRKLLIVGGLLLTVWGMSYGLYYALFDEHQTLESITVSLAAGFRHAAGNDMAQVQAAMDSYARHKFDYVREVDVHSHWSGLALILIVLGLAFDQVDFAERRRWLLAAALVAGSFVFPLGVILQTVGGSVVADALAVAGAALLIAGLAVVAMGFARQSSHSR